MWCLFKIKSLQNGKGNQAFTSHTKAPFVFWRLIVKIEKLEERIIQGEVDRALFTKYNDKYTEQRKELEKIISADYSSSILKNFIEKCLVIAQNLSEVWAFSKFD